MKVIALESAVAGTTNGEIGKKMQDHPEGWGHLVSSFVILHVKNKYVGVQKPV